MDLTISTETYGYDKQSWLGSEHGTSMGRPITVDASLFTANTHYPNGVLPSGTAVGQVTVGGLYGPYDNAASDGRQTLVGFTLTPVELKTASSKASVALFEHGRVKSAKLPFQSGTGSVDSAGKTDAAGRIIFI